MKCVIVKSSAIFKYRRMDAGFYCGTLSKEAQVEIETRQANIEHERRKMAEAETRKSALDQQHQSMVDGGEVFPVSGLTGRES